MNNHDTSNKNPEISEEILAEALAKVQAAPAGEQPVVVEAEQVEKAEEVFEEEELKPEVEQPTEHLPVATVQVAASEESGEEQEAHRSGRRGSKQKKGSGQGFSFGGNESKNNARRISLREVLGGEFLTTDFFRRQLRLFVLLVAFAIIYIGNRYDFQREMITIDRLKQELLDIKYDALTRSSELTEKSRQSHIQEYISEGGSTLETATQPPYLIK